MKQTQNAGFSLIEVLIAIVVLGILVVPFSTGLQMAIQINARADDMLQAQLDVSSAVETLMANGIDPIMADPDHEKYAETLNAYKDSFPNVTLSIQAEGEGDAFEGWFHVTVASADKDLSGVKVETAIRQAEPASTESEEEVAGA